MKRKGSPPEFIYDKARRALAATGGMFDIEMLQPMMHGIAVSGSWTGSGPIKTWRITHMSNFGNPYMYIRYDTGHVVNVPVESDEELQRLAQVFADLINSQYYE